MELHVLQFYLDYLILGTFHVDCCFLGMHAISDQGRMFPLHLSALSDLSDLKRIYDGEADNNEDV